jgi:hypothetical protein
MRAQTFILPVAVLAFALSAFSAPARASVFLNGTNVDNSQLSAKMERCTVTFDGKGNVLISAPGYQVESVQDPATDGATTTASTTTAATTSTSVAAPAILTKKYFVVSEQAQQGMSQYDIDLYIDSKWVRKFHSDDEQVVSEVTQFMRPGVNKILFVAKKNIVGARKSFSPEATYRITLGEGEATGDKVVIDNPLVSFKRSADQTEDTSQEFAINGR